MTSPSLRDAARDAQDVLGQLRTWSLTRAQWRQAGVLLAEVRDALTAGAPGRLSEAEQLLARLSPPRATAPEQDDAPGLFPIPAELHRATVELDDALHELIASLGDDDAAQAEE